MLIQLDSVSSSSSSTSSSSCTSSNTGFDAQPIQTTTPSIPKISSVSQSTFTVYHIGIRETEGRSFKEWIFKTIAGDCIIRRHIPKKKRAPTLTECIIDQALDRLQQHSRYVNLITFFESFNRYSIVKTCKEIDEQTDALPNAFYDYDLTYIIRLHLQQQLYSGDLTPSLKTLSPKLTYPCFPPRFKRWPEVNERIAPRITQTNPSEPSDVCLDEPSPRTDALPSAVYEHEYIYGQGSSSNRRIEFWRKGDQITAKFKIKQKGSWQDLGKLSEDQIAWKDKTASDTALGPKFSALSAQKKAELISMLQEGKYRLVIFHRATSESKWLLVRGVEFVEVDPSLTPPSPASEPREYYYNCRSGYEPNRKLEFQEQDEKIMIKRWAKIDDHWIPDGDAFDDHCILIKGESVSEKLSRLKSNRERRGARQDAPADIAFSTLDLAEKRRYISQLEPEGPYSLEIFSSPDTHLIDQINFINQS